MAKNASPVKNKKILYGQNKSGKQVKRGVLLTREDDTSVVLLNPSGKANKYFNELQTDELRTNSGMVKVGDDDLPMKLTKEQRAYRSGYLDSQKDNAKAYKAKKAKAAVKKAKSR